MISTKREHTLSIWLFAFAYFVFYIPYSGLTKAITTGWITGGARVSGFELLPSTVVVTAIVMLAFVTAMGWWKYARQRRILGVSVVVPGRDQIVSGAAFAVIIATTTIAYSFSGVSIIFALLLMRGGVLVLSPFVDRFYQRKVRWFSWTGLVLSLIALGVAFGDVHSYQLTIVAGLNLVAYLCGYVFRLPAMTRAAKTRDKYNTFGYFAEEQIVAMPVLVLLPAVLALIGKGSILHDLRLGFFDLLQVNHLMVAGYLIGFFYACLGICGTLIYLDRRENTFCIPLNRCSSLLSGVVASYVLAHFSIGAPPRTPLLVSTFLILLAMLVMSPLHHLPLYVKQIRAAIAEDKLVVLRFAQNSSVELQPVSPAAAASFITVNFKAIRDIVRKDPRAGAS